MHEKRRHVRYIVEDMDITGRMIFATEVKILNISISGVSLTCDRRLDLGREYRLKLEDKDKYVTVRGVVVWSTISGSTKGIRGDTVPIYSAGLRFTNVLSDRIKDIIDFIEFHKRDEEQRLSGLRFNIKAPEKAVLDVPESYRVKRLSLGGMLIESRLPLGIENRFPMELTFPDEEPIRFSGRVASCIYRADAGPEHYDIGIEFLNMRENDKRRLTDFIQILHSVEQNPPKQ